MNTKRKVKDYMGQNVAIYCSSKEEWDKIVDLFDEPIVKKHYWGNIVNEGKSDTIRITGCGWSPKEHFIKQQCTIYPASDFLEEDKPFNVGDLVYLEKHYKHETESRDYSIDLPLNSPLEIKSIDFTSNVYNNRQKEWTLWFKGKSLEHPACKFKLWQNTSELQEIKPKVEMLPYPTDKKYFKAVVTKDIHREHISTKGSMPKLIPKGYQTWFIECSYKDRILSKEDIVCPEDNRWGANIPAEYFEIVEDKKAFKFEEGKWYSFNWDWYNSKDQVIAKIKNVFENSINVSWRSYLWGENNYDTSGTYLFEDISNIKELSIEQVQQYLPEGHPDKFKVETSINNTPFKVGDYITVIGTKSEFIGDVLKITEIIDEGKNYGFWFKHIPESFSGGGFRYNAYKDKIRRSTPEEIKNSLILSQYPLTPEQCFKTKPLIKNRNPVVKETIKSRNRLEIKPIKQTIKLKHYVNI